MGRKSTLNESEIFDAVGRLVAKDGSLTLRDVVSETGVSIGSLYHRYRSREDLLALTWLDAVEAFQAEFANALESGAPDAGEQAAMVTPRFCRANPARARVLACCRREELLHQSVSDEIATRIKVINAQVTQKVIKFAKSNSYSTEACRLGLVAFPLGAVQQYLPHTSIPKHIDDYVAAAFRSATGLNV